MNIMDVLQTDVRSLLDASCNCLQFRTIRRGEASRVPVLIQVTSVPDAVNRYGLEGGVVDRRHP